MSTDASPLKALPSESSHDPTALPRRPGPRSRPISRGRYPRIPRDQELALVREVLAGSLPAWHRFCLQYSPVILDVVGRILWDEDAIRTVYVATLENLRRRKLQTFEGRAGLPTWISVVARTEAMDYLRHEYGRRQLPGRLKALTHEDQALFRMFYLEGWPLEQIQRRLKDSCSELLCPHFAQALERIDAALKGKTLRRAVYESKAESVGAAAGRLLEFLDRARFDRELRNATRSTDYRVLELETHELCNRILAEVDALPNEDRRVLTLRFQEGRTASDTAEALGIEEPKRVYKIVERILRTLRRRIDDKTFREAKAVYRTLG